MIGAERLELATLANTLREVPSSSPSTAYRPALDGVRALAVVAVMTAHGSYGHVKGGYHGVEMFFVLSGFPITTILLDEWSDRGHIAFGHFYLRRGARLFPALALAIVGVYLLYAFGDTGIGRHDALLACPRSRSTSAIGSSRPAATLATSGTPGRWRSRSSSTCSGLSRCCSCFAAGPPRS